VDCPLIAKRGLINRSNQSQYFITWSAMPSALRMSDFRLPNNDMPFFFVSLTARQGASITLYCLALPRFDKIVP
jgi:hypothetical protein